MCTQFHAHQRVFRNVAFLFPTFHHMKLLIFKTSHASLRECKHVINMLVIKEVVIHRFSSSKQFKFKVVIRLQHDFI